MSSSVLELLKERKRYYEMSGRDYVINCLNPEHDDRHPSLRIDQDTGIFKCMSCGYKGNIFKHYGIITSLVNIKVKQLRNKLERIVQMKGLEFPTRSIFFQESYRGISANTLKKYEAFKTLSVPELEDRLIFPIRDITGKIQVFVGRHMLSDSGQKYLVYPRHSQVPVFPATVELVNNSVILVEGLFDMLNLHEKGVTNAVCVFGTNTLQSNTKDKLIQFRTQGATKVFIMFDGDKPGRAASRTLKPLVEELGVEVEEIRLEDGKDPGSLTLSEVQKIMKDIYEK